MTIHREGYKMLLITGLISLLVGLVPFFTLPASLAWLSWSLAVLAFAFFLIILQFFRNPSRKQIREENAIICPADGKVVVIEEVNEKEYLKGPCRQISVFMSPINVHINRNPISGLVTYVRYHAGKYLVAWHPKASEENERTTIVIKHANGKEILFRQIAGALAKRICWYVKENDQVNQADEFGFIKFGSRVDIFIPLDAKVNVTLGQKVKGGVDVLAYFQ